MQSVVGSNELGYAKAFALAMSLEHLGAQLGVGFARGGEEADGRFCSWPLAI
jgi:hypothetical protein